MSANWSQLQANAPAMGWPFVRRRMAGELGPDWQSRFKSFEREAARAASLGQVHRAVALDGTPLACKLQYPDMGSAVEADLRQLSSRWGSTSATTRRSAPPTSTPRSPTGCARNSITSARPRICGSTARSWRNEPGVAVPRPIAELSTRRLLTMTWLEGSPILEVAENAPIELRNELALRMFRLWYVPFYYYGVIHGDPHLGNYTVAPGNGERTVNLLDFGCVRIFPARFVKGVIDLYHALERDDRELAAEAYRVWGFGDLSHELIDVLNRWARFVYGPLLDDRDRMIQERAKPGSDGQP